MNTCATISLAEVTGVRDLRPCPAAGPGDEAEVVPEQVT